MKTVTYNKSSIKINNSLEGEPIEHKIERIIQNKEPIKDGAPVVYTERAEGVVSAYNIRTDRWEIAVEAMDNVTKSNISKREERAKEREIIKHPATNELGEQSIGGTE